MLLLKATLTAFTLAVLPVSLASPFPAAAPAPIESCEYDDLIKDTRFLTKSGLNCLVAQDPDCWDELSVSQYVRDWVKGRRGRACGTQGLAGQFGNCFVASYQKLPYCNSISVGACAEDGVTEGSLVKSDVIEVNGESPPITCLERRQWSTVLYNIKSLHKFYNTWYMASSFASGATAELIGKIVDITSPPPKQQQLWGTVLIDALLSGLAFLPVPGLAAGAAAGSRLLSSGGAIKYASTAVSTVKGLEAPGRIALTAAGSVYSKLFPHDGSAASNLIQAANLQVELTNLADQLAARLGPALDTAMNDAESFLNLTETGLYNSPTPPLLVNGTSNLEMAMTTYIVSISLSASTWFVGRAADTTINMLLDGSQGSLNVDYGCKAVDPASGWCGSAVWQDTPNNQGLTLIQAESGLNNPYDTYQKFMGTAVFNKPVTNPELLLQGAAQCRQRLGAGWGGAAVTLWSGGVPNFDCLSQLKVCTWKPDCQIDNDVDANKCEYIEEDCQPETGYGYLTQDRPSGIGFSTGNAVDADHLDDFYVPPGYMGPFRTGDLHGMQLRTTTD
ncbi:MAG: hypothetical protein L6R42_000705 [Xanthoria sp. 1 TBL-2021]|nr:MAG: hypothetical protein L6R42_000705 [Xanthoria sp. 1 TBL-2021]